MNQSSDITSIARDLFNFSSATGVPPCSEFEKILRKKLYQITWLGPSNDASIIFFLSDIAAVMAPSRDIQSAAALSGDTRHDCRSGSCRSFSSSDLTLREFKSLSVLFFYIYCGGGLESSAANVACCLSTVL